MPSNIRFEQLFHALFLAPTTPLGLTNPDGCLLLASAQRVTDSPNPDADDSFIFAANLPTPVWGPLPPPTPRKPALACPTVRFDEIPARRHHHHHRRLPQMPFLFCIGARHDQLLPARCARPSTATGFRIPLPGADLACPGGGEAFPILSSGSRLDARGWSTNASVELLARSGPGLWVPRRLWILHPFRIPHGMLNAKELFSCFQER